MSVYLERRIYDAVEDRRFQEYLKGSLLLVPVRVRPFFVDIRSRDGELPKNQRAYDHLVLNRNTICSEREMSRVTHGDEDHIAQSYEVVWRGLVKTHGLDDVVHRFAEKGMSGIGWGIGVEERDGALSDLPLLHRLWLSQGRFVSVSELVDFCYGSDLPRDFALLKERVFESRRRIKPLLIEAATFSEYGMYYRLVEDNPQRRADYQQAQHKVMQTTRVPDPPHNLFTSEGYKSWLVDTTGIVERSSLRANRLPVTSERLLLYHLWDQMDQFVEYDTLATALGIEIGTYDSPSKLKNLVKFTRALLQVQNGTNFQIGTKAVTKGEQPALVLTSLAA